MTAPTDHSNLLRSATIRLCCVISIGISVGYYLLLFYRQPVFNFDDAHMFIRYAKNFLAGFGHAWNPDGVQTYGSTSLLHFFVVTVLRGTLPFRDDSVLKIASYVMGLPAIAVLAAICSRYSRSSLLHGRWLFWCAVLCPLLLFNDVFLYHSRTGMDTMLAFLCNSLLILTAFHWIHSVRKAAIVPVLLMGYLTFLARPDNGVFALLFPTLLALLHTEPENRFRRIIMYGTGLVVLLLADSIVKFLVFGNPLPLPFYAKSAGFYEGYAGAKHWNPITYLIILVTAALPFLFPVLLWARRAHLRIIVPLLIPAILTIAYLFTATQIMGFHARFFYPSMPFLIVSGALVLDAHFSAGRDVALRFERDTVARLIGNILLIGLLPVLARSLPSAYERAFLSSVPEHPVQTRFTMKATQHLPEVDRWRAITVLTETISQFPEGAVASMSEYGYIGAQAPHVAIIDPLGLHDRIYALHGFSAEDFFARKPDFIWLPHPDYTFIVAEMLNSPHFAAAYDYFPGAFGYGVAIRRASPHRDIIQAAFAAAWLRAYGPGYKINEYRSESTGPGM
jgi:hypothetical protein